MFTFIAYYISGGGLFSWGKGGVLQAVWNIQVLWSMDFLCFLAIGNMVMLLIWVVVTQPAGAPLRVMVTPDCCFYVKPQTVVFMWSPRLLFLCEDKGKSLWASLYKGFNWHNLPVVNITIIWIVPFCELISSVLCAIWAAWQLLAYDWLPKCSYIWWLWTQGVNVRGQCKGSIKGSFQDICITLHFLYVYA